MSILTKQSVRGTVAEPLWTKNFFLVLLSNFATYIGFYLLLPTLPIYIKEMSGKESLTGLAMGVFLISAVLIRPFAGRALDKHGRRGIYLTGLAVFTVCSLAFNWVHGLAVFLLFRFIQGFGWGYCNTAAGTVAADVIPKSRLGEGMGYFGLAMSVAMGIAPAISLFIIEKYTFNVLFSVSALAVAVSLLAAVLIRYRKANLNPGTVNAVLIEKRALRPSLVAFFITLVYSSVLSFLALYGEQRGISGIGIFFTVYAITITLSRPMLGRIADQHGFDLVIIPGLVIVTLTMILFYLSQTLTMFILAGIVFGIGFGAVQPSLQALSVLNVPPERRGAAVGTYFTAFDIGVGLGSVVWGIVADAAGYSMMYLLNVIPAVLALAFYLAFSRQSQVVPKKQP
ncbi:MFS transporter [Paradesulfitobacterium aromaticivorans]